MIPIIEPPDHGDLDKRTGGSRRTQARCQGQQEGAGRTRNSGGREGSDHIQRAVRQIDQSHHTENQSQPGRHQKQHDAELKPIENLLDEKDEGHLSRFRIAKPLDRNRPRSIVLKQVDLRIPDQTRGRSRYFGVSARHLSARPPKARQNHPRALPQSAMTAMIGDLSAPYLPCRNHTFRTLLELCTYVVQSPRSLRSVQ